MSDRQILKTREEIKSFLGEGPDLANPKPVLLRGVMGGRVKAGSFDRDKGTGVFTVTTPTEDSYGDIMVPQGAVLERFRRNPVIPWAHDYSGLPVAKSEAEEVTPDVGIDSMALFAREENPFAAQVFRMYDAGFLNAASIGFLPKEWERNEKKDEDGKTIDQWFGGFIHKIWEFLEWSMLPIPANADALANGVAGLMTVAKTAGMIKDGAPVPDWGEGRDHPFLVRVVAAMNTMGDYPELLLDEAIKAQVEETVKRVLKKGGGEPRREEPGDDDLDGDLLVQDAMDELDKLQAAITGQ